MPKANRLVISNATPIISLALLGQLNLLHLLYREVVIPPAVETEILRGGHRSGAKELPQADYIKTLALSDPSRATLLSDLDRGEAEVIALAQEKQADLILLDERLGRRHALRLGLALTGTVGVLLRAKENNYIPQLKPLLNRLQDGGIRLSPALIEKALKLAGETND